MYHLDGVIEDIAEHLPRYQLLIKSLKEDGYFAVNYARKFINEKDDQTRVRLLDQMCKELKEIACEQSFRQCFLQCR
jgi:hypothetical protein